MELADGSMEKYYVEIPASLAEVRQQFSNLPYALAPELKGASVEDLSQRYIDRISGLVDEAKRQFLGELPASSPKKGAPYLRRVK